MWMIDVKSMNNTFDSMPRGRINPIVRILKFTLGNDGS